MIPCYNITKWPKTQKFYKIINYHQTFIYCIQVKINSILQCCNFIFCQCVCVCVCAGVYKCFELACELKEIGNLELWNHECMLIDWLNEVT